MSDPTLTPAQSKALAKIRAEGKLYPGNGVSISTVNALERLGLVDVERKPGVRMYGPLGPAGGRYRGYISREWVARPKVADK